jgi:hypothetical protein
VITAKLKQTKDIIEFYGLQRDKNVLALFKSFARNQHNKAIYQALMRAIYKNPRVTAKQVSKNPFATPPPEDPLEDDLQIGTDENSRPYHLSTAELPKHVLVAGSTGYGKTSFFQHLMLTLSQKGIRFLSIDFKRDTRKLLSHTPMLILRFNEHANFKFNPLQSLPGVSLIDQDSLFIHVLAETCYLMEGSTSLLLDHLCQLRNKKGAATIHDLYQSIKEAKLRTPRPLAWRDSCLRALHTMLITFNQMLDCAQGLPIQEIITKHNTVLELDSAGEFKSFWATLIPAYYLKWKISNNIRSNETPLHVNFCDEGSLILNKITQRNANAGIPTILVLIQLCREFRESWLISTNEPRAMADTAKVNTATKILLYLGDWPNILDMAKTMTLTNVQTIHTTKLTPGEAVVRKEGQKPHKIMLCQPALQPTQPSNEEVDQKSQAIITQYPTTTRKDSLNIEELEQGKKCPRCGTGQLVLREGKYGTFAACNQYPHCNYTAQPQQSRPAQLTQEQKKLLWHISLHPELSKTEHYKALGLSMGKAENIMKKIRHLVREITIPTKQRGRQPIHLTLTSQAYKELGIEQPTSTKGADTTHDFLVNYYAAQLKKAGLKVEPNLRLNSKEADIGVTLPNGKIIAIEISTTTTPNWELQQIIKNLRAGFDKTITILSTAEKTQELYNKILNQLNPEQQDKTVVSHLTTDITEIIK